MKGCARGWGTFLLRRLLDAFRIFDKDSDGAVSMPEMTHGLRSLGLG
jgi:Ca2+-binding EF-hand superfamily protein